MSVIKKIIVSSIIIILGIGLIGLGVFKSNQRLLSTNEWLGHTKDVIDKSQSVLLISEGMEIGCRGFIVNGDSSLIKNIKADSVKVFQQIKEMRQLLYDNAAQKSRVDSLNYYIKLRLDFSLDMVAKKNRKDSVSAVLFNYLLFTKGTTNKIKQLIIDFQQVEELLLIERNVRNVESQAVAKQFSIMLFFLMTALSILMMVVTGKYLLLNKEKQKKADDLIIANKELAFQNNEKEKRAAELFIANKELAFQNIEKENRAAELVIANEELSFQNNEKEKKAFALIIANKELLFQNEERQKRAAELVIANAELAFQNGEKEKRSMEVVTINNQLVLNFTKRKKAEQEMAWLVNNTEECFVLLNHHLEITSFNNQFKKLYLLYLGINIIKGRSILEYTKVKWLNRVKEIYAKVLAGSEVDRELAILKDKAVKHFCIKYKPAKDEYGKTIGVFITAIDITEKRRAEKLKEFERRDKEALINTTTDLMWSISSDFKLIAANQPFMDSIKNGAAIMLNPGSGLTLNMDFSTAYLHLWQNLYMRALQGESFIKEIHTPACKSLPESWAETRFNPIYNGKSVIGVACFTRDTTIARNFKNELVTINNKLEAALQISQLGYWEMELDTNRLYWSKEVYKIWGVSATTFEVTFQGFYETIHPADRGLLIAAQEKAFAGKVKMDIEYRIILPGKTLKYIHEKGTFQFNHAGKATRFEGTMQDITARKLAEMQLKESNERFTNVSKATFDAIWDWDISSGKIFLGDEFINLFGSVDMKKGTALESLRQKIHPNDIEQLLKSADLTLKSNKLNWSYEHRYLKAKGGYATVYNKALIIRDASGMAKRVIGAMRDRSEEKNLEGLLDKATRMARIGSWEIDLIKGTVYWSDVIKEIHETDICFTPDLQGAINFYKKGISRQSIIKCVEEAKTEGKAWDLEVQIITVNNHEKWVRSIGETEAVNGRIIRIYGSFQDIDLRKRAELAAVELLQEKNDILESIDDAFFAVDKKWTVTYWNNQAEKMLQKPKEEMLGHPLWQVFSMDNNIDAYLKYQQAIDTARSVHFEDYYPLLSAWYEISAYPSSNGLSVYFKDISKRKQAELQFFELNKELQNNARELAISNAELEQFAYVASHDMQEPLRMITSFLTQLEKKYADVLDSKGKTYIGFAVDGAKRMQQIILDLLEFSQIGGVTGQLEYVDLNILVEEMRALFQKENTGEKEFIYSDKLPVLLAYKTPFRQVFQNLISNALKYRQQGIAPQVHISVQEHGEFWKFSITDNGIGIASEYFEKIFIIFQRLHRKNEFTGTGIGLAITKKIIESYGGQIWVTSEEGKGSSFHFTLLRNYRPMVNDRPALMELGIEGPLPEISLTTKNVL